MRQTQRLFLSAVLAAMVAASPGTAQQADPAPGTDALPESDPQSGPVTGLPLPRFVSIKAASANARRGPSLSNRVDWEFTRKGQPVRVTAEYENWRRVEDSEGAGGWVHYSLLSSNRTVLITDEQATLYADPSTASPKVALAMQGVIAALEQCDSGWCEVEADGYSGWVQTNSLWGLQADEGGEPGD